MLAVLFFQQRDEKIAALQQSVQADETNIAALKTLLQSLATQVDTINANYVTRDEYNRLVDQGRDGDDKWTGGCGAVN